MNMLDRFNRAFSQVLHFVQSPADHLARDESDYNALRDIATLIIFLGLTIEAFKKIDNELFFGVMLTLAVLLSWPISWILMNISAAIFEYYLEWVAYKRVLKFQPNRLTTQRIVVYASISFIITTIPVTHINYISTLISILLTGLGLKILYGLKYSEGMGLALAYNALIFAIVFVISFLITLIV